MFLNRLDFQALPSIRGTERKKEIEGTRHSEKKGRQRKRSMEATNINSFVLISFSSPKRQKPLQGHPPITAQIALVLPLEQASEN